ncbi:MAG: double-strand break repair protein AddB [Marinosulfonomonas sp.]
MFQPSDKPRVFACPPGADFPQLLVQGLRERTATLSPENLARVEIFVNTRRMQRRIKALFDAGPACLLPRVRLVTDLANDPAGPDVLPAVSPLRRRLELSQLVARLLDQRPELAPRSAIFDLSDSLALLLGEMQDEGVTLDDISNLDVTDRSGHWQRSLDFLKIAARFFGQDTSEPPDAIARQRIVTEQLIETWKDTPPDHPIIVAGSTGSRGTTAMLMRAVASLPQGAIILPGFDFELPDTVWEQLNEPLSGEDHPQYRFAQIISRLGLAAVDVTLWAGRQSKDIVARNQLLSLALRPAPFTSQWMKEGPELTGCTDAAENMTLLEAPSDRVEAVAVAMILREAAETGKKAALVTPDRLLTRRVSAALDRWKIEPDVSVGEPLDLSAPGRLLRHVSDLFGRVLTSDALLAILKHPLTNSGGADRGQHLLWTRELEMKLRRYGPPFPKAQDLLEWAAQGKDTADRYAWAVWVVSVLFDHSERGQNSLSDHLNVHIDTTTRLADGPNPTAEGALWKKADGQQAWNIVSDLRNNADYGGQLNAADYGALFLSILKRGEVRDPLRPHPNIMIWGTLEARVQGADLVVLGGLNDGVWPELPSPDPWLNREMRANAGLLVPERRVGLSAHDFQQAAAAKEVVMSRSIRNAEAETVPSRWINRLTNLMEGMSNEGKNALNDMRSRGEAWVDLAEQLDAPREPVPPEPRPAPMPPVAARPDKLSVTAISRLIRDPYAIYAANVLRLRKLDPLHRRPDAPLRGTVLHAALEEFIKNLDVTQGMEVARENLMATTDKTLLKHAPWPAARALWRAKIERVADKFLSDEFKRQTIATPLVFEIDGKMGFADLGFTLIGKADRIDRTELGRLIIYDYKTGSPPSKNQLKYFDKQLLLEAMMAEAGAFETVPHAIVAEIAHISLGSNPKYDPVALEPGEIAQIKAEFIELITQYQRPDQGYTSRRAMVEVAFGGDFDHLARFGEWDETQEPARTEVSHGV